MKLRIKSGFDVVNIDGHYVIKGEQKINQTIILDEISLFLWNNLNNKDFSKNEMLDLLLNKFEISTVLALGEIDKFVRILKESGIIE
jgi:hypothetical protein